jgi:hypothetical protein
MKFGKRLAANATPEWQTQFLNYKGLKKRIKVIQIRRAEQEKKEERLKKKEERRKRKQERLNRKNGTNQPEDEGTEQITLKSTTFDKDDGTFQLDNVQMVDEIELEEEIPPPKRNNLSVPDNFGVTRSTSLYDQSSPFSSNYSLALAAINNRFLTEDVDPLITICVEESRFFLNCFQHEIDKINKFYTIKENEYLGRYNKLEQQIEALKRQEENGNKLTKNKIRQLQAAFQEHYRSLILLENYRKLNYVASTKIMKKFAKYSGNPVNEKISEMVRNEQFFASPLLKEMMENTEQMFTAHVVGGNRKEAMRKLRLPTTGSNTSGNDNNIIFRCGMWIGISLILSGLSTYIYLNDYINTFSEDMNPPPYSELTFFLFRVMAFPVILSVFIAINIRIWTEAHINYVFIFELNPRRHLTMWQFMELSLIAFCLWIGFFAFYLFSTIMQALNVFDIGVPWVIPLVLFGVYALFIFFPAPYPFGSARWWLIKIILKVLAAPFVPVKFADFWFADQLTSMSDFLFDMQFVFCIYPTTFVPQLKALCDLSYQMGLPLLNMLPILSRLLQCLRRFYDSRDVNQLANAGKYLSTVMAILATYIHKRVMTLATFEDVSTAWLLIWFTINIWSTLYKYIWDVVMDWGLFRVTDTNYKLLRKNLLYSPIWYYAAMIMNFAIRTLWLWLFFLRFYISTPIWDSQFIMFGMAFAELFRRFVWNIFRLENEHLNNADKFRAVVEMPLPFEIDHEANAAEDREKRKQMWTIFKSRLNSVAMSVLNCFKARKSLVDDIENDDDVYGLPPRKQDETDTEETEESEESEVEERKPSQQHSRSKTVAYDLDRQVSSTPRGKPPTRSTSLTQIVVKKT